jgi:hypothetical protein
MPMYKCPHCDAHIDHVAYRTDGYEYGNYDPDSGDYDYVDSSHDGDTYYECPQCDEEINDPDSLEVINENEEEDTAPPVNRDTVKGDDVNPDAKRIWQCSCGSSNTQRETSCFGCGEERPSDVKYLIINS